MSGRGGWKTTHYSYGETRVLNQWEQTAYEKYCEYCRRVCDYPGGPDWVWYIETSKLPSV